MLTKSPVKNTISAFCLFISATAFCNGLVLVKLPVCKSEIWMARYPGKPAVSWGKRKVNFFNLVVVSTPHHAVHKSHQRNSTHYQSQFIQKFVAADEIFVRGRLVGRVPENIVYQ